MLNPEQIAAYAYKAGFRGKDLVYAVAIALKESGGDPKAYNPELAAGTKPGSGSRGLWQIYGGAHPEYNNDAVYDPMKNAEAAYAVYKAAGSKFTPWSTWNNGSAQSLSLSLGNIGDAAAASLATIGGTVEGITGAGGNAIAEAANSVLDGIGARLLGTNAEGEPREMADAMAYFAGAVLIGLGLIFLFVKSGAAEGTVKLVGKAAAVAA
jgi:hypothetical protein